MTHLILIVDDDPTQRRLLEGVVEKLGYKTLTVDGGKAALELLDGPKGAAISAVMLDLIMPDMDGHAVLAALRPARPSLPVIVLTAQGGIDTVVSAMRSGADDFVVKPASPERIQVSLRNALKMTALNEEVTRLSKRKSGQITFDDLIAKAPATRRVIKLAQRAAESTIPILIGGESGVGKELIARAIQAASDRADKPFVTVNCGAIPENLVESILFGHEKGAFTGATEKHVGKFVEANGGTLFLDEIGELRPDIQVKLLRALQEGEVDPVGAKKPIKVDIRLISATNRDLLAMAEAGDFREDLYYRLNVFPIDIAPLRERADDIPDLVQMFLTRFASEENKRVIGVRADAMAMLTGYSWPGNVRQLENAVFRAVVLADGEALSIADFPQIAQFTGTPIPEISADTPAELSPDLAPASTPSQAPEVADPFEAFEAPASEPGLPHSDLAERLSEDREGTKPLTVLRAEDVPPEAAEDVLSKAVAAGEMVQAVGPDGHMRPLEEIEGELITRAIERYNARMSEVARRLGIGRSTLYRKVRELGLEVRDSASG